MSNITYGRGQVEQALWRTFTRGRSGYSETPPKVFLTRVKRLLDIDRDLDLSDREVQPTDDFAFVAPPEKRGGEVAFSPFDAFCLAVALDLLDAGFKQSEVVYLMRFLRAELESRFESLVEAPDLNARRRYMASDYPSCPKEQRGDKTYADPRVFVLIKKFEILEALPSPKAARHIDPLFLQPEVCRGVDELGKKLSQSMPAHRRVVTVVELTATAQSVCKTLEDTPEIRRGRPKS